MRYKTHRIIQYSLAFALFYVVLLFANEKLSGKVIKVSDGDTFTLLTVDKKQIKVRFHGIDTPEKAQQFGSKAKQFTSEHSFGKTVTIKVFSTYRYGRTIGEVILSDGRSLNRLLVENGYAWWYKRYAPDDRILDSLEQIARKDRRGLWRDSEPIAPWDWRKTKKTKAVNKPHIQMNGNGCSFWLNVKSGVRHNTGCKYYKNTAKGRCCTQNDGKKCGICGG